MGYSIIFKTKIVNLSDGRILHLDLSGCNNDTEGRNNDDWKGRIYTKEDFIKYAEGFKSGSKSAKESEDFDLKIGNRYCTLYDYGTHLLRMMKKAVSFDELKHCGKYVSFNKVDGVTVIENGKEVVMTTEKFEKYAKEKMYKGGCRYRINYILLNTEDEVIAALDNKDTLRIYISK